MTRSAMALGGAVGRRPGRHRLDRHGPGGAHGGERTHPGAERRERSGSLRRRGRPTDDERLARDRAQRAGRRRSEAPA
jgi:hypothetical protein